MATNSVDYGLNRFQGRRAGGKALLWKQANEFSKSKLIAIAPESKSEKNAVEKQVRVNAL